MISFDGADWGTNSDVLVSLLLDVGTFAERLWNVFSFTVLTLLYRTKQVQIRVHPSVHMYIIHYLIEKSRPLSKPPEWRYCSVYLAGTGLSDGSNPLRGT
jgi:hypothetical protein